MRFWSFYINDIQIIRSKPCLNCPKKLNFVLGYNNMTGVDNDRGLCSVKQVCFGAGSKR